VDQTTGAVAPAGAPRNNCLLPAALVYDPLTKSDRHRCGIPTSPLPSGPTTAGIPAGSSRRALQTATTSASSMVSMRSSTARSRRGIRHLNEKIGAQTPTRTAPRAAAR